MKRMHTSKVSFYCEEAMEVDRGSFNSTMCVCDRERERERERER